MQSPDLPDTTKWQPKSTGTATLQSAFMQHCVSIERLIKLKVQTEKAFNINNFDAGLAIEDIFREEFAKILPSRYSVESGVVVDRSGLTGGEYDFILFNDLWFPQVKVSTTPATRRSFYPIEGIYAVGEIKQTLSYKTLDSALEKLVKAHRLNRPLTNKNRLIENRESSSCTHGLSNPLYSFVLATDICETVSFDSLITRFVEINQKLDRLHVVRALCVLEYGTVIWCYKDRSTNDIKPALFMLDDLYESISPGYLMHQEHEPAMFTLLCNLMLHVFHSVLAAEDIATSYGYELPNPQIKMPGSPQFNLAPDAKWLERLHIACEDEHD